MSARAQLTKDLNESIKNALSSKVKILFKAVVRWETKSDKTENRVLVFSPCRMFLLTTKIPTKIDCNFHYLEIQALESRRGNHFSLTVNDRMYSFLTGDDSTCSIEVDDIICALCNAIRSIFPTVPLQHIIKKFEVIPNSRLKLNELEAISGRDIGPCGGFSRQYLCMCDFHGMAYRDEVAWDVDNIYVSLNTRELCLKDFDYLDQKDFIPIISVLEYNTWFISLRTSQVKLSHDNMDRILMVIQKSMTLEEIHLDSLGIKPEFMNKLSNAVRSNPATALNTISVEGNSIEDKGAYHLSNAISKITKGLVHLSLANCNLNSKGMYHLSKVLNNHQNMLTTLRYLNLSTNFLKDDIAHLTSFLSHPNVIQHLDLSSTDVVLENLFSALVLGCTTHLAHINVSKCPISTRRSKIPPLSFKQFFSAALSLKYLNISHCRLPQEALKNLLLGLACNELIKDVNVDMSNNYLGNHGGGHVIESCVHGVRCLSSLDISENNMDGDLSNVISAISKNKSIRHLYMGRSMRRHMALIMDAVVQWIQDPECALQTLSMTECRLRSDIHVFLNALADNKSLQTIDISGNSMGDSGARLLAKALQMNRTLHTIIYDRNNITFQGYSDLLHALNSNKTLIYMPYPIHDVLPCLRANGEKTDTTHRRIQNLLNRNASLQLGLRPPSSTSANIDPSVGNVNSTTPSCNSSHSIKGAQSTTSLLQSKQQALSSLMAQMKQTLSKQNFPTPLAPVSDNNDFISSNNDINNATSILEDANQAKIILLRLQEIISHYDNTDNPVVQQIQRSVQEIHQASQSYMQVALDKMVKCCSDQCPTVFHREHKLQEMKQLCNELLLPNFSLVNFKHQAINEIMHKIRKHNLAVAAQLSEQVMDEVHSALLKSYKILDGDLSAILVDSPPQRSRLSSSDSSRYRTSDISITDSSHQSDHSPMATPHLSIKRKSGHGRKLRPKSVADKVEDLSADDFANLLRPSRTYASSLSWSACDQGGDIGTQKAATITITTGTNNDKTNGQCNAESETESITLPALSQGGGEDDSLSDLPSPASSTHQQLKHLVKNRARRTKTRAPSRSLVKSHCLPVNFDDTDSNDCGTEFRQDISSHILPSTIAPNMDDGCTTQQRPNANVDEPDIGGVGGTSHLAQGFDNFFRAGTITSTSIPSAVNDSKSADTKYSGEKNVYKDLKPTSEDVFAIKQQRSGSSTKLTEFFNSDALNNCSKQNLPNTEPVTLPGKP